MSRARAPPAGRRRAPPHRGARAVQRLGGALVLRVGEGRRGLGRVHARWRPGRRTGHDDGREHVLTRMHADGRGHGRADGRGHRGARRRVDVGLASALRAARGEGRLTKTAGERRAQMWPGGREKPWQPAERAREGSRAGCVAPGSAAEGAHSMRRRFRPLVRRRCCASGASRGLRCGCGEEERPGTERRGSRQTHPRGSRARCVAPG